VLTLPPVPVSLTAGTGTRGSGAEEVACDLRVRRVDSARPRCHSRESERGAVSVAVPGFFTIRPWREVLEPGRREYRGEVTA
jgi:hypothetical protein